MPDSRTYRHFREQLISLGSIESLFAAFNGRLDRSGVFANEGKMVGASFVDVPKQRNTREENKQIKEGKLPSGWEKAPYKLAQKDTDARWTKKNNVSFYGNKNHVKADTKTKLIQKYAVTDASVHCLPRHSGDSQVVGELLDATGGGQEFYSDSAYKGKGPQEVYAEKKSVGQGKRERVQKQATDRSPEKKQPGKIQGGVKG